jgi:hypothetical protein
VGNCRFLVENAIDQAYDCRTLTGCGDEVAPFCRGPVLGCENFFCRVAIKTWAENDLKLDFLALGNKQGV